MAEMTIRLQTDPQTGKKNIVVSMHSDEDALPHEHEHQHRNLVDKLIEGGLVGADEVGEVIIDRVSEAEQPASEPQSSNEQTQRDPLAAQE